MSVNHPLKMQFFRFANSGAALVDAMGGVFFGSLPGVVLIFLWQTRGTEAIGATALIMLLTGGLYFLSVRRFGNRFEQNRERIAAAVL
jgi:glucose uptake protein GlcU